jgi:precorrin isomerase
MKTKSNRACEFEKKSNQKTTTTKKAKHMRTRDKQQISNLKVLFEVKIVSVGNAQTSIFHFDNHTNL